MLEDKDITSRTGLDPGEKPNFRGVLIERIRGADGFLGIWTGGGSKISPWLLWELAIAEAFEIPFRLVISSKLDKQIWKSLSPEKQNCLFGNIDFKEQAQQAIDWLLNDINNPGKATDWSWRNRSLRHYSNISNTIRGKPL